MENIELTLPSGKIAVIKSYIPHKVARKIQSLFIGKRAISMQDKNINLTEDFELTGDDALEFNEVLVNGLLIQLGNYHVSDGVLEQYIEDLDERDFEALSAKCGEIYTKYNEKTNPKE